MTNLRRRLRKLEAEILDSHGLIPNTPEWLEFWVDKLDRLDAGEDVDLTGMTLAVVDAIIEAGEREEAEEMAGSSVGVVGSERFV
jgi:hypothetical protein